MKEKHAKVDGIEWRLMGVRDMQDVAFDKGTPDTMIHGSPWSPPKDVRDNTSAYLKEVSLSFIVSLHFASSISHSPALGPEQESGFRQASGVSVM